MADKSGNPFLSSKRFKRHEMKGGRMTVDGTANKSLVLIGVVILVAALTWFASASGAISDVMLWVAVIIAAIGGLLIAIILAFKPDWSPQLAVPYAALEGIFVGAVSLIAEQQFPGARRGQVEIRARVPAGSPAARRWTEPAARRETPR